MPIESIRSLIYAAMRVCSSILKDICQMPEIHLLNEDMVNDCLRFCQVPHWRVCPPVYFPRAGYVVFQIQ